MDCKEIKEILDEFIEGKSLHRKAIENHLNTCEDCKKDYELLKGSIKALKSLKPVHPPAHLWKNIKKSISTEEEKRPLILFRPVLIPVMLSIIIIFMGFLIGENKKEITRNAALKEVYYLLAEKNYSLALKKVDNLLKEDNFKNNLAELTLLKGKCYDRLDDKEKAMKIYKKVTKKYAGTLYAAESYYLTGLSYERAGNYTEASKNYMAVIEDFNLNSLPFSEDMAVRTKVIETILVDQEELLAVRGENREEKVHQKNLERINNFIKENISLENQAFKLKEAELFINKEEFEKGLYIVENLLKEEIGEEKLKIKALFLKGKSLYGLKRYEEGKEIFEKIIKKTSEKEIFYKKEADYYLGLINSKKEEKKTGQ